MSAGERIGLLGLGHMGSRIALKLLEAGVALTVWDRDEGARRLLERGAALAGSPRQLAGRCDVVVSCLADDGAVVEVALGESGALAALADGAVYVECNTVSPDTIAALVEAGERRGVKIVDATMSGARRRSEGTVTLQAATRRRSSGRGPRSSPGRRKCCTSALPAWARQRSSRSTSSSGSGCRRSPRRSCSGRRRPSTEAV